MPIELLILVIDEAAEEEIKAIARTALASPVVMGVFRHAVDQPLDIDNVTHDVSSRMQ